MNHQPTLGTFMNFIEIEKNLVLQNAYKNKQEIIKIHKKLSSERIKLDRWFDKYLDIFSEKLNSCAQKDPVKVLYDKKFAQYGELTRLINASVFYLKGLS